LYPAACPQAALQAIMTVENARQRGARLSAAPHVRTFLRLLSIDIAYRGNVLFFSINNVHRVTPVMMLYKLPEFATEG
jgi:hypothetical protein